MTTLVRILPFLFAFVFFSCDTLEELEKLSQFDMDYNTEVTIPSSSLVDTPFNIPTIDVDSNSSSLFESNNTSKDLIEQINLKQLKLVLQSPNDGTLNFLKTITVYISAEGLEEKKIAWKNSIPEDTKTELTLDVTSDDLKDYLITEAYKLRFNTVNDKEVTEDQSISINTTFFVDAKILGL